MTDANAVTESPQLLTLAEAATFLRTPVATLRYWRHCNVGPAGFRLGRRVLYRREELHRWVAEQQRAQSLRRKPQAAADS